MTQKIAALVDGSIYSQSVCTHAAWFAHRTGAPVEIVHVLSRHERSNSDDLSGAIRLGARSRLLEHLATVDEERARLASQHGRAILEDASELVEAGGVTEVTTHLRSGDLVEAVAQVEKDAGLLVIGKRGEAADFAKGHLGSNMERIVRASHRPVLVASRGFQPIEKALLAFDGGPSTKRAVDYIAQSAAFKGLDLSIVTVGNSDAILKSERDQAVARLRDSGVNASSYTISGTQPETALAELVEAECIGMVVMGAYGHSRIRSLVIGSTTTSLVRACKVPMLLIR